MPKTAVLSFDFDPQFETNYSTFNVASPDLKHTFSSPEDTLKVSNDLNFRPYSKQSATWNLEPENKSGLPSLEAQRQLNRRIIEKTPKSEIERIEKARQDLVQKKYDEGLTSGEERKLVYFRWQLDRFEEARLGPQLDYFERIVQAHENLARSIESHAELILNIRENAKRQKR
jgi:hypothetical protein